MIHIILLPLFTKSNPRNLEDDTVGKATVND